MRKQSPPGIDDAISFSNIIQNKRLKTRNRLNKAKSKVLDAYALFESNTSTLSSISSFQMTKILKADLINCYDSNTAGMKDLKSSIHSSLDELSKNRCPYCSYREPSAFDHYLPKAHFAEFASYSKNLIWVCHQCNTRKSDNLTAGAFLNTYYDDIPAVKFLYCELLPPFERTKIRFFLQKPATLSNESYNKITSHFYNLKLDKSYLREASLILPGLIRGCKTLALRTSADVARISIEVNRDIKIQDFGQNHYEVALLDEMLAKLNQIISS